MKRTWHTILIILCSVSSVGMSEPLSPEIEAFGRELIKQASELQSLGYQYEATVRYEQFVYPASPFGRKYAEPRKEADFLECRQRLIARGETVRICATMVKTNNVERFAGPLQIPVDATRCVWYTDKRVIAFWADGSALYEIVDATPTSVRGTGANNIDLRPDRLREWLDISYPAHQFDRTQAHFQGANIFAYREDPIIDPQADRSILWMRPKADGDIVVHARVRIDVPANPSHNDSRERVVRLERVGGELSLVGIAHSIQRVPDRYQTTEFPHRVGNRPQDACASCDISVRERRAGHRWFQTTSIWGRVAREAVGGFANPLGRTSNHLSRVDGCGAGSASHRGCNRDAVQKGGWIRMTTTTPEVRSTFWTKAFIAWRLAVSIVFFFAVIGKLYNSVPFVAAIEWLGVPLGMRAAVLWTVVLVEVSLAGWLLLHRSGVPVWAACSLLPLYMLALTRLAISPAPPPCSCLGFVPRAAPRVEAVAGLVRNALIIGSGIFVLRKRAIYEMR